MSCSISPQHMRSAPASAWPTSSNRRQRPAAASGLAFAMAAAAWRYGWCTPDRLPSTVRLPVEHNPVTEDSPPSRRRTRTASRSSLPSPCCAAWPSDGAFEVIPVRAFNHIGPGERGDHRRRRVRRPDPGLCSPATRPACQWPISRLVRDFTDVRDIARGYADLAERGVPGRVYNLCSGRPATVGRCARRAARLGAAWTGRSWTWRALRQVRRGGRIAVPGWIARAGDGGRPAGPPRSACSRAPRIY